MDLPIEMLIGGLALTAVAVNKLPLGRLNGEHQTTAKVVYCRDCRRSHECAPEGKSSPSEKQSVRPNAKAVYCIRCGFGHWCPRSA